MGSEPDTPQADDAFVDESPRRPLVEFPNPWTACITGILAFLSLSLGMSILTVGRGSNWLFNGIKALPDWAQAGIVILVVLTHFASVVCGAATLINGLRRTGDDAAVLIRGRRFGGWRLGAFYFGCYGWLWLAYALRLALRY